jgi:hypothetical protein
MNPTIGISPFHWNFKEQRVKYRQLNKIIDQPYLQKFGPRPLPQEQLILLQWLESILRKAQWELQKDILTSWVRKLELKPQQNNKEKKTGRTS